MKELEEISLDEIDKYIKLGQEVEAKEKCPYCHGNFVIQHMGEIFLCGECGATLEYNFKEMKWQEEIAKEKIKKEDSKESK